MIDLSATRRKYKGCLKSFWPQHEDGFTRQQKLGNLFVSPLKDSHQNFSYFGCIVVWKLFE